MKKLIISIAVILAVIVVGGLICARFAESYRLRGKPRRQWKDNAIADIARLTADSSWLAAEIAALKAKAIKEQTDTDGWLSPHFILMKNGEWIVYANVCHKENWRIHDIFIGRAADGTWYYSTFHFCIGMIVLRMQGGMEGQPQSVSKFVEQYYLHPFDGRSDECLKTTWPVEH